MVLSVIQDIDINNAEKYVCGQLSNILKNRSGKKPSNAENTLIFGKNHATSPNTFCFTPGERILIRRVSEYLKENTLPEFIGQIKRENYSTEKTILTSLGTIFGNEADLKIDTKTTKDINVTSEKKTLLKKAKDKLKEFDATAPLELLTEEMILIDYSNPSKMKGQVKCVYCNEYMAKISAKYLRSSCSWVMSNLTTHLKSCEKAIKTKKENETKAINVTPVLEDYEIQEVETRNEDGDVEKHSPLLNELNVHCAKRSLKN